MWIKNIKIIIAKNKIKTENVIKNLKFDPNFFLSLNREII
jgi:hypothetical protein